MKISSKKAIILILSAVLIACAALIAGNETKNASVETVSTEIKADPIEKFRTERQQLRAMQKAQLNDIVHDASADAETAKLARRQLLEICSAEEQELTIEGILEMRGFVSPVVTVHSASVNVLIRAEGLTKQQTGVILDLVCRETGAMAGDIKIIPIN